MSKKPVRVRKQDDNSLLTPKAEVMLYEERIKNAESSGSKTLANYYRSLLNDAKNKLNGGFCL